MPQPGPRSYTELDVGGRPVRVSTPERVLWQRVGMTKAQLLDYYIRIAPVMLPHLVGRPVTLGRYPYGVEQGGFFQTRCPPHPEWVRTQRMHVFSPDKQVDAVVIDDLPSLVWAANLSTIELHPYLACAERLEQPDFVVFDLDPGPPADLLDACRVALRLRDLLDGLGLVSLPKTSGGKGFHVYAPVSGATYADTKPFARAVAALLTRETPDAVIDRMARNLRGGKVFIDWSQNDPGKSTVVAYSVRAQDLPSISTPLTWNEVGDAVAAADWRRLIFGPGEVHERVDAHGDLFAQTLAVRQTLPALPHRR